MNKSERENWERFERKLREASGLDERDAHLAAMRLRRIARASELFDLITSSYGNLYNKCRWTGPTWAREGTFRHKRDGDSEAFWSKVSANIDSKGIAEGKRIGVEVVAGSGDPRGPGLLVRIEGKGDYWGDRDLVCVPGYSERDEAAICARLDAIDRAMERAAF